MDFIGYEYQIYGFKITGVLGVLLCTIITIRWLWDRRRSDAPPLLDGNLPLIGNLHQLIGDYHYMYTAMVKMLYECLHKGGVVRFNIIGKNFIVVTDPEDFLTIANTCYDKTFIAEYGERWVGKGLVTANSSTWKVHRKLLNPLFNHQALSNFMEVFNMQSRRLVSQMEKEVGRGPFDPAEYLQKNALETTYLTILGKEFKADSTDRKEEYYYAINRIMQLILFKITRPWYQIDYIYNWTNLKKDDDYCIRVLRDRTTLAVQEARKKKTTKMNVKNNHESGTIFKPFVESLLEFEEGVLTNTEIEDEVNTLMATTYDSSAITLALILALIGSHAEVQEKIYKEIIEVLGSADKDLTMQDAAKMVYLEATIKECLRLYPAAPIVARSLDRSVKLKKYTIPATTTCLFGLYGLNRNSEWGPDPEEFNPEKWLLPDGPHLNPNLFATFSLGKRYCVGKTYAMLSTKTALVHFIRNYRFTADFSKAKINYELLLKIKSGGEISIEPRKLDMLPN